MKIVLKERGTTATCERCKKQNLITKEHLKLVATFQCYKLYSFECQFCKKKDYIRDDTYIKVAF